MLSYHFLAKNLGHLAHEPALAGPARGGGLTFGAPFKVNEHGLALWFTTPLYFWLLWPKRFDGDPDRKWLYVVALPRRGAAGRRWTCSTRTPGWRQFGYRFSNDYAVLLFVLLAVGRAAHAPAVRRRRRRGASAWNLFGAITFDKGAFDRFYFRDGSQTIVYQPD